MMPHGRGWILSVAMVLLAVQVSPVHIVPIVRTSSEVIASNDSAIGNFSSALNRLVVLVAAGGERGSRPRLVPCGIQLVLE